MMRTSILFRATAPGTKIAPASFLRVFGNQVLNVFILLVYGFRINDSQSGMWVFKRELLSRLNLTSDTMAFSEEIKLEAFSLPSVRCKELVIYYKERYGESKLNIWRDGFANLLFIFKKRFGVLGHAEPLVPRAETAPQKLAATARLTHPPTLSTIRNQKFLMFSLRFDPKAIEFWASRFPDSPTTLRIMNEIAPRTRKQGALQSRLSDHLRMEQFTPPPRSIARMPKISFVNSPAYPSRPHTNTSAWRSSPCSTASVSPPPPSSYIFARPTHTPSSTEIPCGPSRQTHRANLISNSGLSMFKLLVNSPNKPRSTCGHWTAPSGNMLTKTSRRSAYGNLLPPSLSPRHVTDTA